MKVCLFGATGATGSLVLERLLKQGHKVTAYVRNPDKITKHHDLLKIIQGDIHDITKITSILKGQDCVISTLGSSTTKKSTQLTDMSKSISTSMKEAGVNRIVYMATAGIEDEFKGLFKFFVRVVLGNVIDDHKGAAEHYKNQGFNYTIIRPVQLKDGETTGIYQEATTNLPHSKKAVSRGNVAMLIVKSLNDENYYKTSIGITE